MKRLIFFILILSTIIFCQVKGSLVIIGGGRQTDEIRKKIIELAGGKDSKILIIPMASSEPKESALGTIEEMNKLGCNNIDYLICNKNNADDDTTLSKLDDVKGIYFSGGDQNLLTKAILGTKFLQKIKDLYKSGIVLSGTSAGAAVMSKIMITGNELVNKDSINAFNMITRGNIETSEGFGFLENTIVDQHFIRRKRMNRLISLVIENPKYIGIGIDESTAIVVKQNKTFEVIGESIVMVLNARNSKKISEDKNKHLSIDNINLSILKSGDLFNLVSKKVSKIK